MKIKAMVIMVVMMFVFLVSGCEAEEKVVYISAASSMQESLEEVVQLFNEEHPDVEIRLNFGGSNMLRQQILEGFEADVFISAHYIPYNDLVDEGKVYIGQELVQNQVVLVTSSDDIENLFDIVNDDVRLILANAEVPIGIYSRDILAMADENTPGFKQAAMDNLVSEGDNVRQVLMQVALQEGDVAFVYKTDIGADIADDVRMIVLPDEYQIITDVYIALINREEMSETARLFYDFILSKAAFEVFVNHGFE